MNNSMDWNNWRDKVHKTAVDHGFYDKAVPFEQTIALIHSELSEALEEMRAGRKPVWYACEEIKPSDHPCDPKDEGDCLNFGKENECKYRGKKAEGCVIELADAVIRILDYFGYKDVDASEIEPLEYEEETESGEIVAVTKTPMYIITDAHSMVSSAWDARYSQEAINAGLRDAAGACITLIQQLGCNVEELIKIKSDYNESRPYKHGKAF